MSMFDRYTEAARRTIFFARLEALHRDEESIGARDILIGLTWEEGARADRLAHLKDRAADLRASLGIPHLPSTALPYLRKNDIPLDSDGKKLLAYAASEADCDRQFWVDTDHLLRGILRFPNPASEALAQQGIELNPLRSLSRQDRLEHPPASMPKWSALRFILRKFRIVVFLLAIVLFVMLIKLMGPIQ